MVSRVSAFGILIGAAVGTLVLVPAHSSAQDSLSVFACQSRLVGDLVRFCAERGVANAQVLLGVSYRNGEGVPEDDAEAVRWFRLAAEQRNAFAQFLLGVMYAGGEGVPEDNAEAVRWYRLAAEQGDASAQLNLGFMYGNGYGVPEDLAYAYMWYNLSAAQGNETAQSNKDIIEQRMTRERRLWELRATIRDRVSDKLADTVGQTSMLVGIP